MTKASLWSFVIVHNDPAHALCDGPQSLKPEDFDPLAKKLLALHAAVKSLEG